MSRFIFVDCEADGNPSPATGRMTEFGAVDLKSRATFHGHDDSRETFILFRDWINLICKGERPVFVSDNPAFDWQWINFGFDRYFGEEAKRAGLVANPFGHSARRISDYYAGLVGDWNASTRWKRLRVTRHDHNPVHDAMGNVEAFVRLQNGER